MPIYDPIAECLGLTPIILTKIDSSMYEEISNAHPFKGKKHTKESKRLISLSSSSRIHTEETKKKIALSNTGKVFDQERRDNISRSMTGKKIRQPIGVFAGVKNPRYDHTIYHFNHQVHGKIKCTKYDLCVKYGITNSNLCKMISGKYKSVKGWSLFSKSSCASQSE